MADVNLPICSGTFIWVIAKKRNARETYVRKADKLHLTATAEEIVTKTYAIFGEMELVFFLMKP